MNQTAAASDVLLSLRGLSVDYLTEKGSLRAVDHLDLDVRRGEIVGLAGESGSGKSTLALAVTRLLPAWVARTEGSIEIAGEDVMSLSPEAMRQLRWKRLAIVFQGAMNSLNPVTTIQRQITDALVAHGELDRARIRARSLELMDLVEIDSASLNRYPHELSGGMRQRAVIAIALALNPDLLLMDEPTTALDVVVQRQILAKLVELQKRLSFAVLFVTHDLSLLLELCDRIAVMYAGRLMEVSAADTLATEARHPYTQGLLRSFPSLSGPRVRLSGIPGSPPSLASLPSGCPFHPRCPLAEDRCRTSVPPLRTLKDGPEDRLVACHRAEEVTTLVE
jgi:peptide/nickel transport system ATP-binding protein